MPIGIYQHKKIPPKQRFDAKWTPEPFSGCWIWTAAISPATGYGAFYTGSGYDTAHRISWTIYCGSIPKGLFVCHHCDTRSCVNPDHLFLGTSADNSADMARKGRVAHILSSSDINEMRISSTPSRKVGKQFGVSHRTVQAIRKRETWKHI